MLYYLAQGIGFVGLIFAVISFQKNSSKGILTFQVMATFTFFVHFTLLVAFTGAIMNLLGAARNIVFYNNDKGWAKKQGWMYFFILLYIVSGILTWKNNFSALPTFAMVLSTVGLWLKNPKHTRLILLICSPCWLVYNIASKSFAATVTESFIFSSILAGIIRFDILPKFSQKKEKA